MPTRLLVLDLATTQEVRVNPGVGGAVIPDRLWDAGREMAIALGHASEQPPHVAFSTPDDARFYVRVEVLQPKDPDDAIRAIRGVTGRYSDIFVEEPRVVYRD